MLGVLKLLLLVEHLLVKLEGVLVELGIEIILKFIIEWLDLYYLPNILRS